MDYRFYTEARKTHVKNYQLLILFPMQGCRNQLNVNYKAGLSYLCVWAQLSPIQYPLSNQPGISHNYI